MSGGSFNYLYCKDSENIFEYEHEVERMADKLLELGYEDVSKMMFELLYVIKHSKIRIDVLVNSLSGVMRSVEWYCSADSGIDSVEKAVNEYRVRSVKGVK